jgi:hypothetical protein
MNKIQPDLLSNTLNLIQLARETAAARGATAQAEKLAPVVANLTEIITSPASTGQMGQSDFQTLMQASEKRQVGPSPEAALQRNGIVNAMAEAGMNVTDIARQMGMSQEEVHLVLDLNPKNRSDLEVLL